MATANLAKTLRRTRALVEAARLITASGHDLDAVLDALTDQAMQLLGADAGSIHLAAKDGGLIVRRPNPLAAPGSIYATPGTHFFPRGQTGRAVATRRLAYTQDYERDERIHPDVRRQFPDVRANLVVPLVAGDDLVGTLHVVWSRPHVVTDEDLEMAEALGAHAAVAIRSANLVEYAREEAARAEVSQRLSAALAEALTQDDVAKVVIEGAIGAIGASAGVVGVLSGDGQEVELVGAIGYPERIIQPWHRFNVNAPVPIADVIRFGQPILIESGTEVIERYPGLAERLEGRQPRAIATLPIALPTGIVGALSLSFNEDRRINPSDWRWLVSLSQRCAMALDRARLYEQARRSDERYRLVAEAAGVAVWEWDAVTNEVVWSGGGREVFGYAPSGNRSDMGWWLDRIHPDDRQRLDQIRLEARQSTTSAWTHEYRLLRADGTYVPVIAVTHVMRGNDGQPGRALGMIMDASRLCQAEAERDRLAEALVRAEERQRVAMDLHDGVIQQLFGASMVLMGLQRRTGAISDDTRDALQAAVTAVESAHRTIRGYMEALRSPVLPQGGLRSQLEVLAHDLRGTLGIRLQLHVAPSAEDPLPPSAVSEVLQIAREAAANAVRHGHASMLSVEIKRTAKRLVIVFRDDGAGLATQPPSRVPGHGLANMAERARRLGGTLRVTSPPGGGVEVRLELPLGAASAAKPAAAATLAERGRRANGVFGAR